MSVLVNVYNGNREFYFKKCGKSALIKDLFIKTSDFFNLIITEEENDDIPQSVFLKGIKLSPTEPLEKYLNDLEYNALFISNDPTKEIILNQDPIEIKDYKIIQKIGSNFRKNFKAIDTKTGQNVLFKYFRGFNEYLIANKVREIYIVRSINISGIVKIQGYKFLQGESIIIKEFMKYGPVGNLTREYIKSKGSESSPLNPTIRSKIIFGVAVTMKKIHANNIYILNLNANNIFLDDHFEPKISNLKYAKFITDNSIPFDADDITRINYKMFRGIMESSHKNDLMKMDVHDFAIFLYQMFSSTEAKSLNRLENIPDCYWDLICKCKDDVLQNIPSFDEIVEILKHDKFALNEFGKKTDMDELHEYQERIEKENSQ